MARVKIVDTFNGGSGPSFSTYAEAQRALAQREHEFFAHPGHQHTVFCQTIVPEHYEWYFDPRQNKFIWG